MWEEDKTAIASRFGAKPFDDPLAELMKLRQSETVEQYQEVFDSLLNRVESPVAHAVSCFLSGLNKELQNAVRMFKPHTLHDAYCLAKLQKATLASIARKARPILDRNVSYTRTVGSGHKPSFQPPNPIQQRSNYSFPSYKSTPASSTGSVSSRPRTTGRSLSPKDLEKKRAKNLCFFVMKNIFLVISV